MKKKTIIKVIKVGIIVLIFFFIGKYLYDNISTLDVSSLKFNYGFLLASVLIYLLHILVNMSVWYLITRQNSCALGFWESLKVRIFSDFGKYIPGKVFAYGILFYSYDQKGISKKKVMVCSLQELIAGTLAAILVSLISLFFVDIDALERYRWILVVMVALSLVLIHPAILKFFLNLVLKTFKREPLELTSTYGQILLDTLLFLLNWLLFGVGFFLFIHSFYDCPISYFFYTTGAFALAGIIGFVAIFAPAGLGVREGVLVFILSKVFPAAVAAIIAVVSRIWMTLCELILLAVFYTVFFVRERRKKNGN